MLAKAVVLSMRRQTEMLDWSLRKALVARKAAFSSRMFMWLLASEGDQRPFAVESLQHAPQPALDASDVMYKSGAGGFIGLPFTVTTFRCYHCNSVCALMMRVMKVS